MHTAPYLSGPLSVSIPKSYSRSGRVVASSRCTSGGARRPVNTLRVPLCISKVDPHATSWCLQQLHQAVRSRRNNGDARALDPSRLTNLARVFSTAPAARSAAPETSRQSRVGFSALLLTSVRRLVAGRARLVRHGVTPRPAPQCSGRGYPGPDRDRSVLRRRAPHAFAAARGGADRPTAWVHQVRSHGEAATGSTGRRRQSKRDT